MSIDLTKLKTGHWKVYRCSYCEEGHACNFDGEQSLDHSYDECHHPLDLNEAEFIALAGRAFDVMMRRGWGVAHFPCKRNKVGVWMAIECQDGPIIENVSTGWPDPFTALVEADRWYKENVESHR